MVIAEDIWALSIFVKVEFVTVPPPSASSKVTSEVESLAASAWKVYVFVTLVHSVESHLVRKVCNAVPSAKRVLARRYWGSSLVRPVCPVK